MPSRRWNPGCACCTQDRRATFSVQAIKPRPRTFHLHNNCYGYHTYEDWQGATVTLTIASGSTYFGWANGTHILPLVLSTSYLTINKAYTFTFQIDSGSNPHYVWRFTSILGVDATANPNCQVFLGYAQTIPFGGGVIAQHARFNSNCSLQYSFSDEASNDDSAPPGSEHAIDVEASGLAVSLNVVF